MLKIRPKSKKLSNKKSKINLRNMSVTVQLKLNLDSQLKSQKFNLHITSLTVQLKCNPHTPIKKPKNN